MGEEADLDVNVIVQPNMMNVMILFIIKRIFSLMIDGAFTEGPQFNLTSKCVKVCIFINISLSEIYFSIMPIENIIHNFQSRFLLPHKTKYYRNLKYKKNFSAKLFNNCCSLQLYLLS